MQQAPVARRRRRWPAIAALLALLLAVLAAVWWVSFTRSPTYSVGMLGQAVADRDWTAVTHYVDVDAVTGGVLDDTLAGALGDRIAAAVRPTVTARVRTLAREAVERGMVPTGTLSRRFAWIEVARRVREVRYQGADTALVTVSLPYAGRQLDLVLRMRRTGPRWRVVGLRNAASLPGLTDPETLRRFFLPGGGQ